MKNISKIISFTTLFILIFSGLSFGQNDLENQLVNGKWLNYSDGYKKHADSEETVKRYKGLQFEHDGTCIMDSTKRKFEGTYRITSDNHFIVDFKNSSLSSREGYINENGKIIFGEQQYKNYPRAVAGLISFYEYSGFGNVTLAHLIMVLVGLFFIFLAIRFNYEPLLLIPIGVGIIIGNIPFFQAEGFNLKLGIYQEGSVMNYLYFGVRQGIYPPLIFLGIGAMTDFSSLISNPRLMLLGAAAQIGIFLTFLGALVLGYTPAEAGAIGIIGGADGPTAIFLSST